MISGFLIVATIIDLKTRCIPNWFVGTFFFIGSLTAFFQKQLGDYIGFCLIGLSISAFGFWIRAIGGGDVKLVSVLSGWVRSREIGWIIFVALTIAACVGMIQMIYQRKLISRMQAAFRYLNCCFRGKINEKQDFYKDVLPDTKPICFSIYILAGYWIVGHL